MTAYPTEQSDRRYRHGWQVVRQYANEALIVCCSHRWQRTAQVCAGWREFTTGRAGDVISVRSTPREVS
ncbi:hypothetical protein Ade02nite_19200 [Paractinoplanes deccanensis]|uniref:Uncharacterized protein n=1 Tax=Paractinoplanes deccanensis TaxID=113561 RepID=A0ABQ3XZU9_9ACTN|nr:hypothetical protein [Actinoplanes deccanensis]GID73279.1 hypothetical protein Ade02nite_19200 [Actinoplanes deccanensis]